MFAEQFNSLPVGLLLASSAISLFTGGLADAAMILSIVVINAVIGYTTEAAAERWSGPRLSSSVTATSRRLPPKTWLLAICSFCCPGPSWPPTRECSRPGT
jgi:hypothetical protein